MTRAEIQPYLDADPFEPLTITQTGGWVYEVLRRGDARFNQHGSLEVSMPDGGRAYLSIDHITSIVAESPPVIVGGKS